MSNIASISFANLHTLTFCPNIVTYTYTRKTCTYGQVRNVMFKYASICVFCGIFTSYCEQPSNACISAYGNFPGKNSIEKKRSIYILNEIFKHCMNFMHAIDVSIQPKNIGK